MLSRWPATTAVAAVIFALSEMPQEAFPDTTAIPHVGTVVHVVEYLVLGALLFRSLCYEMSEHLRLAAIITLGGGTLFGALDEWHQAFTGRVPDGWDVLANIAGLLCGVVLAGLVGGRRRKHGN